MAKKLMVNVTQSDIDNGTRASGLRDAIAEAIKRQTGCKTVLAGTYCVTVLTIVNGNETVERYRTSETMARFMREYDAGHSVRPTTFVLRKMYDRQVKVV